MKIFKYSVSRGKSRLVGREVVGREVTESRLSARNESGGRGKSVSTPYSSLQQSLYKFTIQSKDLYLHSSFIPYF